MAGGLSSLMVNPLTQLGAGVSDPAPQALLHSFHISDSDITQVLQSLFTYTYMIYDMI